MKFAERIAIVPGSFDPITKGHIEIIKEAAKRYDRVYVAVMINDQKKYMFDLQQRKMLVQVSVSDIKNVSVIASEGWLWSLAKELGACAIVKGYRNDIDLEYEQKMAKFNEEKYPDGKTVLIKASVDFEKLSSTVVRQRIINKEGLEGYISDNAIKLINEFIK